MDRSPPHLEKIRGSVAGSYLVDGGVHVVADRQVGDRRDAQGILRVETRGQLVQVKAGVFPHACSFPLSGQLTADFAPQEETRRGRDERVGAGTPGVSLLSISQPAKRWAWASRGSCRAARRLDAHGKRRPARLRRPPRGAHPPPGRRRDCRCPASTCSPLRSWRLASERTRRSSPCVPASPRLLTCLPTSSMRCWRQISSSISPPRRGSIRTASPASRGNVAAPEPGWP